MFDNNPSPGGAPSGPFIAECLQFDRLLERLRALRAAHFGADPEAPRNWAEIGSVREANRQLEQVLEFLGAP